MEASLGGLPGELGGARIGWVLLNSEQFDLPPKVMCVPPVLIRQGIRLWGRALPAGTSGYSGEVLMNAKGAYYSSRRSVNRLSFASQTLSTPIENTSTILPHCA